MQSRPEPPTTLAGRARERILQVADYLFYTDGIRQVPIEEIAYRASVSTRAFSRAFPAKEALVVEYINRRHKSDVDLFYSLTETAISPHLVLNMVLSEVVLDITSPGFHGCAFINAAIECRESTLVQAAVRSHREWYAAAATEVLREAGHAHPGDAADDVLLARDGAMNSN
jgi:AcrR family transcriptional regulator